MDLIGRKLSELSSKELEDIVIFLDIDDTLGKAIEITEINKEPLIEYITDYRLVYVYEETKHTFIFCYYKKYQGIWKRLDITFRFRESVVELLDFFKRKDIHNVYFLSAAVEEYIEGIQFILQQFYYFDIKGYHSVSSVEQKMILEKIDNKYRSVLYMEKDMVKAKAELNIPDHKIPILFDDRPYWGKNGYVVPIHDKDHIDTFIHTPIQLYKEPLYTIDELSFSELFSEE